MNVLKGKAKEGLDEVKGKARGRRIEKGFEIEMKLHG